MAVKRRRICWPSPDAVCLQGGCLWCQDHPQRSLKQIYLYARSRNLLASYAIGQDHIPDLDTPGEPHPYPPGDS